MAYGVAAAALLGSLGGVALFAPPAPVPRRTVDWADHRRGPVDERRVYWVGHSLMNHRDEAQPDARNLIEEVGRLAEGAGLAYASFDHTFFGAPLSLNWTGAARSFPREEPEALARRRELEEPGQRYDALVMTEAIPVGPTMEAEAGSYYAQRFYCAAVRANPDVDVYVLETWTERGDGWRERLTADRAEWERLADEAAAARVPEPGRWARLAPYWTTLEPACEGPPIHLIPVGQVLRGLAQRIERSPGDWRLADGAPLTIDRLFANPVVNGSRRYPDREADAIHPSALGAQVAAMVSFATLYRRSPPAPAPEALDAATAARLRALVWETVREDPRAGVH